MEKCVVHRLKNLGPSQEALRPLVSQAGYGPVWAHFF